MKKSNLLDCLYINLSFAFYFNTLGGKTFIIN